MKYFMLFLTIACVGIAWYLITNEDTIFTTTSVTSQIRNCIEQGGGWVKTAANDTYHVIKDAAEGKVITTPTGDQFVILSVETYEQLMEAAQGSP